MIAEWLFYWRNIMSQFSMKKSPFGCILDEEKQIDSYGVDHSGFSLRDELAYQIARTNQEEKLQKCFNNQGITKSYPQFGNSFWGGNSANNYGFGSCNIEENIDEMKNRPLVPLTEVQKAKSRGFFGNLDGVAGEALEGFGKGAVYGATRPLNGASFGALDWADRQLGGNLTQLGQEIQQDADLAGIGTLNKYTNNGLELAGGLVGGVKTVQAVPEIANQAVRWNGRRQLVKQLKRGEDFKDINFGKLDKDLYKQVNEIRKLENVKPLTSRLIRMPSENTKSGVKHIFKGRIQKQKYTPKDVDISINNSLFGKNSKAIRGKDAECQVILSGNKQNPSITVIGRQKDDGKIFVKTTYPIKDVNKLFKNYKGENLGSLNNVSLNDWIEKTFK